MATTSLSKVNNRAGDTGFYISANECLAIKPDASLGSLQDALGERLNQAHAVIQMLAIDAAVPEGASLSNDIVSNGLWAAGMLIEHAKQFLAELNIKTGTDWEPSEGTLRSHRGSKQRKKPENN